MRTALITLIGIHGIIHLLEFLKAYGIVEFNGIGQFISKISGLFWLLTFLLFAVTIVLFIIRSNYWWALGFIAVIASQFLIFYYWSDTKFGTIANLIILLSTILGYSNYRFHSSIKKERIALINNSKTIQNSIVDTSNIKTLPPIVQKWLKNSGVIGKPVVSNVHLTQELKLKLKPEQDEWSHGTAEQYFTIYPPAFNWNLNSQMNPLMNIVGRDKFEQGNGEMLIKLLSIFPVADVANNDKINQATLQRYLAEIIWFPSASISTYIQWEELDENSARATMEINGTKGSGIFYFDEKGLFKRFIAMRFKDSNDIEPIKWAVIASKTEERNGIKIPTKCEASWSLKSGQWTWLKLNIKDIKYNLKNACD